MENEKNDITMLRLPIARTFAALQKTLTCRRNYPELAEKIDERIWSQVIDDVELYRPSVV